MIGICPFCEKEVKIIEINTEEHKYKCSFCKKEWKTDFIKGKLSK